MSFYSEVAADASALLTEFGQTMTLTRPSGSAPTYNPDTGVATPVSPATYSMVGAKFDYTLREVDGNLVHSGDQRIFVSVDVGVLPRPGDLATINGSIFRVMRVSSVSPAATPVLYELQVRQ